MCHRQAEEQERVLETLQLAAGQGFDYCKVGTFDYLKHACARSCDSGCKIRQAQHAAPRPRMTMLGAPVVKVRAARGAMSDACNGCSRASRD